MKQIMNTLFAFGLGLLAVSANAFSDMPSNTEFFVKPGFHFALSGGMTFGGDTVYTAHYTDGSTVDVKAGGLLQYGIGESYHFAELPLELLTSINIQNDWALGTSATAPGTNAEAIFSRYPIEVLAYYTGKKRLRFGGGVRFVKKPEFEVTYNGTTNKVIFDKTTGIVVEAGYQVNRQFWVNMRFVSEKYVANRIVLSNGTATALSGQAPFNGSHLGLIFSYEF